MNAVQTGNFSSSNLEHRGWVVGHFLDPDSPFKITDFELKWGNNPRGARKSVAGSNQIAQTLAILIRGKIQYDFPETNQTIILDKEGDYIYWSSGVSHKWEVLEDVLTFTLRWPSLPDDQIPQPK